MSFLGSLVEGLVGQVAGEGAGALAQRPLARFSTSVRRRMTLPVVVFAWASVPVTMFVAWRLGLSAASTVGQGLAVLLWIGGPVNALVLTDLWRRRRDA